MPARKAPRTYLHERIAETLAEEIGSSSDSLLPTIQTLARRFDVANATMWKAISLLRKKGLVVCRRGRRIAIVRTQDRTGLPTVAHGAVLALYQQIKNAIADGTYRVGDVMPKRDYFVLTAHISPNTLTAALRTLESESLIFHKGKKWVVGKTNASLQKKGIRDLGPVVLALVPSYHFMFGTLGLPTPFAEFMRAFIAETQRFGMHVQVVATPQLDMAPSAPGNQDVRGLVTALGKRYRGTLVASIPFSLDEKPFVNEHADWLQKFREPVILFYSANRSPEDFASFGQWKRVYRMFQEETQPVRLAFSTLVNLGHSKIAVADYVRTADYARNDHRWSVDRARTIQRFAAQHSPQPEIFTLHHRDACWHSQRDAFPEQFVKQHFDQSRSLVSLVKQGVTALIAPNDTFARKYYALLTAAGVSVPKDVSLISFDNDRYSWLYPMSTIDFGFANLGYRAAHIFLGDIPVGAGRNNRIQSEPFLLDRGSLGPPRNTHS